MKVTADDSAKQKLLEMGFAGERAVEALQACNNDVSRAMDLLIDQLSTPLHGLAAFPPEA
ncbi:hypothetical protein T484DRAFT_1815002 [Baffinella frigidus]|nr:hypothetical protein T484DRAFT_1815002 [Cryptophyta sp. CCMP2293]